MSLQFAIMVLNDGPRYPIQPYHLLKKSLDNVSRIIGLVIRDKMSHFGESINHYKEGIFNTLGLGQA